MPELPEVEMVRRGLEELIVGRRIIEVIVLNPKSFQVDQVDLPQVINAQIKTVRRFAKVLVIDLSTDNSLVIHLKMTGQMVIRDEDIAKSVWGAGHPTDSFLANLPDRSTKVIFNLTAPEPPPQPDCLKQVSARLFFNDQRIFGWIKVVPTNLVESVPFIAKLGPTPLDPIGQPLSHTQSQTAEAQFLARARRHTKACIKAVILDQTVIAGVGNIYADEALWAAKVHPATPVRDLSDSQLITIFQQAGHIMATSLAAGGSTMRTYFQVDGTPGSYLEAFANVFGRDGYPCPRCGTPIEKHRLAGRGTHLCPRCQPRHQ